MIGERENIYQDNTNYGTLVMRAFDIDGNKINAFYDSENNLVFVLDNTINAQKPNVLLVINSDGDKKWDEILSSHYGVDLETIRPKVDNKYQKLDIEYSGLGVYEALINAYNAGDGLDEYLNQLFILRDSAARHSAMVRLNIANETISKTNTTIVKTKESIVRLEARIKTLRSKLSAAKKEIGRVNTKQSASKILKLESQIEATNEKLKRAKKRLGSAQRRLEAATVDAELASDLLNQPATEMKQIVKNKPITVAKEYPVQTITTDEDEEDVEEESDIKPLFEKDPQILNEDIAFKPISFDAPVFNELEEKSEPEISSFVESENNESKPVLESITPIEEVSENYSFVPEPVAEERPIIESFEPIKDIPEFTPEPVMEEKTEFVEEKPVLETMQPVAQMPEPALPPMTSFQAPTETKQEHSKPGFIYYMLLLILILLSVFTLWLYQKNMTTDTKPVLTTIAPETTKNVEVQKQEEPAVASVKEENTESVFLDEGFTDESENVSETVPVEEETDEEPIAEPVNEMIVEEQVIEEAPVVIDAVPERLNTSGSYMDEDVIVPSEEDILARKPVYEPGAKYDDMFVSESDIIYEPEAVEENAEFYDDSFNDAEEEAYQSEEMYY